MNRSSMDANLTIEYQDRQVVEGVKIEELTPSKLMLIFQEDNIKQIKLEKVVAPKED